MFIGIKSSFAKRCLSLCGIAGLVLIALVYQLVNVQLVNPKKSVGTGGDSLNVIEILPPQRGRIMDANEEILTNNIHSVTLTANGHHLTDVKVITWPLAYATAIHRDHWLTLKDEDEKDSYVAQVRTRMLKLATKNTKEGKEHNLAKILIEPEEKDVNAVAAMQKRNEKLYDQEKVNQYILNHVQYAAQTIAPHLPLENGQTLADKEAELINIIAGNGEVRKKRYVLAKNLTEEKAEIIKAAVKKARVRGIDFEIETKRSYPIPECLTHVLGYMSKTEKTGPHDIAQLGLEKQLDDILRGHAGVREFRQDSKGRLIPSKDERFMDAVDGLNVRLTINMEYQTIVEEELEEAIKHYTDATHSPKGCIIVVEPKTGNILAMASRPHFNLNTKEGVFTNGSNFAYQALYEPGSTFKVVAVTTALDTGKVRINDKILCTPCPIPGSRAVTDGRRSYGTLTVAGVLKKSSNPGTYRIGQKSGWEAVKKYIDAYGFTSKTGIALPDEPRSRCTNGANIANFSRICYGYSISVTPLQIAMAYATIANNGIRMKPRLIDGVYLDDHNFQQYPPEEVCRVMKESTAKDLKDALWHVTDKDGTGYKGRVDGYHVGGKTGTAHKSRKADEGGGYYPDRYAVSFAGMMPIEDPAFVCLVIIDDPTNKHHKVGGASVCAPVFKKVATRLAAAMNLPKSEPEKKSVKKNVKSSSKKPRR